MSIFTCVYMRIHYRSLKPANIVPKERFGWVCWACGFIQSVEGQEKRGRRGAMGRKQINLHQYPPTMAVRPLRLLKPFRRHAPRGY